VGLGGCEGDMGELGLGSHGIAGIDQYLTLNDLFIRESDGFVLCFRWATPRGERIVEILSDEVIAWPRGIRSRRSSVCGRLFIGSRCLRRIIMSRWYS
jgi:hypothetical protein